MPKPESISGSEPPSVEPPAVPAAAPEPMKKGAPVFVKCDGYNYETVLSADDDGGKILEVPVLGKVARGRVTPRSR